MNRDQLPATLGDDEAGQEEGCDIVIVILRRVIALSPEFDLALAGQIEAEVRAVYGGLRVRIPKRAKHMKPRERAALFRDALTPMPTEEILRKHKISLRTLERNMKRGGRFDRS
jgi:hypothetical protein